MIDILRFLLSIVPFSICTCFVKSISIALSHLVLQTNTMSRFYTFSILTTLLRRAERQGEVESSDVQLSDINVTTGQSIRANSRACCCCILSLVLPGPAVLAFRLSRQTKVNWIVKLSVSYYLLFVQAFSSS
jgi:hypothetical protein